ncbi:hypothetical protein KW782_02650 [Candidatus Parcubacteria bacterium]|nr:hypothetical protein [Candidatus Parcubacteria bacterium]
MYHSYYELILLGFIIDTLYNAPVDRLYNVQFVITIAAIILVIISTSIKARLRFYD